MKKYLRPEWRTQSRTKRKFYAKYLRWVEQLGYLIVTAVFAAFIYAFNTKADDVIKAEGVRIEAASTPITASEESIIVRRLVPNFSKVSKGTLVLEIHSVASSDKVQPSVRITAPADGVFVITESEKPYAKGDTIAKILNYSKLIAQAELEGATVGKAREGQPVRLSAITYSDTGIVFRGSSQHGGVVSGQFFNQATKDQVEALLRGQKVKARDDIALTIEGVKSIQVDSAIDLNWGVESADPILLDPPPSYVVSGVVVSGSHVGTLQTASLPAKVKDAIRAEAERRAQEVALSTKETSTIKGFRDFNTVVQVTVKGQAPEGGAWPATIINRQFVAQVSIPNPPPGLVKAVMKADRNGTSVTARVEVVTGSRPLALTLLKK